MEWRVCDTRDNDCDGAVDEDVCLELDLDLEGTALTVTCPRGALSIACNIDFQGGDLVAVSPHTTVDVYLKKVTNAAQGVS